MFPKFLEPHFEALEVVVANDENFKSSAKAASFAFGLRSSESDETLVVSVDGDRTKLSLAQSPTPAFTLSARANDWEQFLAPIPKAPFQSYWGILRSYGTQPGVQVLGDTVAFANHSRVWRLFLEEIRTVVNRPGENKEQVPTFDEDEEDDVIFGRYVRIDTPLWGKSRVFCEYAGSGSQHVLFLHTAGSDSRQYHALMNEKNLQRKCTMYAFDLPGHGRSDLGTKQQIGNLKCDEEAYVNTIKQVIQRLNLQRPIVCGASMAGQVCLAVALRASELGISGVIPCEACEHLSRYPAIYGYSDVAESVLNPESVCGMMSPTAPAANKRLVWWSYSSQGTGVFKGDLTFYFQGWDGRGRMGQIDTKACPVHMLTGEYDYSCTPATSKATADQIPGKIRLEETFKQGSVWDPKVSFGPLYGLKAVEKVERHFEDAISKGARVFLGGHIDKRLGPNFYVPTILTDTTREILFFSEETFGPIAPLTLFNTEEEAIQIANDTNVGLAAYFYTEDISRQWRVSEALEVGMVGCRFGLVSACEQPFGGIKESGIGREGSKFALDEYVNIKSITVGL